LVKTCHPDRIDKSLDIAFQELANKKLQELNAAYEEAEALRGHLIKRVDSKTIEHRPMRPPIVGSADTISLPGSPAPGPSKSRLPGNGPTFRIAGAFLGIGRPVREQFATPQVSPAWWQMNEL